MRHSQGILAGVVNPLSSSSLFVLVFRTITSSLGAGQFTAKIAIVLEFLFLALFDFLQFLHAKIRKDHYNNRKARTLCAFLIALCTCLTSVYGYPIMSFFVTDHSIIALAAMAIRISSVCLFLNGLSLNYCFVLSGCRDAAFQVISGSIEIVVRIVFAFLLTSLPSVEIYGIWLTAGITFSATLLAGIVRYRRGKWKKAIA